MPKHQLKLSLLAVAVTAGLTACGGGEDNIAPEAQAVTVADAQQWMPVTGQVPVNDPNGDELTFTASVANSEGGSAPGTVSITNDGTFTYVPLTSEPATINVAVSDGELTTNTTITIEGVAGDPLADSQWHLRNTGQLAYSQGDALLNVWKQYLALVYGQETADAYTYPENVSVPGEDMNVAAASAMGITGKGSIAVIVDSGLELNHEDLRNNVLPGASLNFVDGADPSDPTNPTDMGDHGTSVAGLIAAEAWNGKGGRGVAPEASIAGMNYLQNQTDLAFTLSHGLPGTSFTTHSNIAVFNRSYGISAPTFFAPDPIDRSIEQYTAMALRDGKGAINAKSNGNSFGDDGGYGIVCELPGRADDLGLTCLDGNFQASNSSPYYMTVAAVNADGSHVSYSTAGSNTFISAPSGEYGQFYPAMVTTDQSTCLKGYASFAYSPDRDLGPIEDFWVAYEGFDFPGNNDDNAGCNYTSHFNGTSSAAPNMSGVVALLVEANPSITWREILYVLANTATEVTPDDAAVVKTMDDGEWVAHDGWVENAAGYHFNNLFGFGRVNAGAAVEMAKAGGFGLGDMVDTDWVDAAITTPLAIPDNAAAGVSTTITVEDDITIENLTFRFTITNPEIAYAYAAAKDADGYWPASLAGSDLGIEVTSPSGTRSVLLAAGNGLFIPQQGGGQTASYDKIMAGAELKTNAFYGESAQGTWTIRVVDTAADNYAVADGGSWFLNEPTKYLNNSVDSTLDAVSVRVMGH